MGLWRFRIGRGAVPQDALPEPWNLPNMGELSCGCWPEMEGGGNLLARRELSDFLFAGFFLLTSSCLSAAYHVYLHSFVVLSLLVVESLPQPSTSIYIYIYQLPSS